MTRVEAVLADSCFTEYVAKNNSSEADRQFCRHTFQHLVDVARITYILMLESGDIRRFMEENDLNMKLAKEMIYAAGVLHDIGRWKEYQTGEDHSVVSSVLAGDILRKAGFDSKEIRIITTAIREHRRMAESMSLLGERLYRADNLSRLCSQCEASDECHKYDSMETGRKALIY